MQQKAIDQIKSRDEAREMAIDWQAWQQGVALSYGECAAWADYFRAVAKKFHLLTEFKENGIL